MDEVLKLNNKYKQELIEIDTKYSNSSEIIEENVKELEINRKVKKN